VPFPEGHVLGILIKYLFSVSMKALKRREYCYKHDVEDNFPVPFNSVLLVKKE